MIKVWLYIHVSVLIAILSGCVASSVTPTGSNTVTQESSENADAITIFYDQADVGKPFKTVGIISYRNPGKWQVLTLNNAIPELKKKASSVGANGIIIDKQYPIRSGIISTGIGVEARAIRF